MPTPKYLINNTGTITETAAASVGGAIDSDKIPALDVNGKLTLAMMPSGLSSKDVQSIATSESLNAGNLVNIWNNAGVFNVRNADATSVAKRAHGYVLAAFTHPATAEVYFEGTNTSLTGLTAGDVYLATTAGQLTNTPPSGTNQIIQRVGVATSATSVNVEFSDPIVLA